MSLKIRRAPQTNRNLTGGSNTAGGFRKHLRRVADVPESILRFTPGKVIEAGLSKLSETGKIVNPNLFGLFILQLFSRYRASMVLRVALLRGLF